MPNPLLLRNNVHDDSAAACDTVDIPLVDIDIYVFVSVSVFVCSVFLIIAAINIAVTKLHLGLILPEEDNGPIPGL